MIYAAPDYLPISRNEFIKSFINLFSTKIYPSYEYSYDYITNKKIDNYIKIYGYSCRTLFETFMSLMPENMIVATTPLHHTSYRNIIEKYVKRENIILLEMNENYNKIVNVKDVLKNIDCDLIIVTHLFGQDLDIDELKEYKIENNNILFVEDRVQGGSLCNKFSDNIFDISFYSCGMDKRPVALGGGFVYMKQYNYELVNLKNNILEKISMYPEETRFERFFSLIKKIPTYILYNNKTFIKIFMNILRLFCYNFNDFAIYYRNKNPGFIHDNYLKRPSKALMKSMHDNKFNYCNIEKLYESKFTEFSKIIGDKIYKYIPMYKEKPLLTPYNTFLLINNNLLNNISKFVYIQNPTYKTFSFDKSNNIEFCNNLYYMPSLSIMNKNEMEELNELL